ncbi:MAG: hypothetical protein H0T83_03510 [Chthoniobacterales bacterium]|nr:hypothetical protein [Chthoniobacterales bacterium]
MNEPPPSFKPSDAPPTYQREIPAINFGRTWAVAVVLFVLGFIAWELKWRAWGAQPTYRNSDGAWSMQRRRIDAGEGGKTVLLGASRVLFDVQLQAWERVLGERPIQLAVEGTTPLPILEDLAENQHFNGRLLVGVAPDVFFTGFGYRENVLKYHKTETLAQRGGQWLSMQFIEPFFAFYDDDFRLMTVLRRQPWARRPGVESSIDVRKLTMQEPDRNTHIWSKVENDPAYRELCRRVWAQGFDVPISGMETPADIERVGTEQIARAAAATAKLRTRGVPVVFVRPPSAGRYLEVENRDFPRAKTWDVLLLKTGAPGIHFEDHPELQGLNLPEWSHLAAGDAEKFTEGLCRILQREKAWLARSTAAGDP